MTKAELQIRLELHRRELRLLEGVKVECPTCEYWFRPQCMKYKSDPPPEVVQQGCDDWTYDFIPF